MVVLKKKSKSRFPDNITKSVDLTAASQTTLTTKKYQDLTGEFAVEVLAPNESQSLVKL